MASYEKLTPEIFKTRLGNNEYQDLTGARRAIGRVNWPDADKDKARKLAEAKFGTGAAPAKKAAAPKAAKKAATKTVAKTASKPGPKGKPGPKPKVRNEDAQSSVGTVAFPVITRFSQSDIKKNPLQMIQLAEQGVQSGTAALNAITTAQHTNPQVDASVYTEARKAAVNTICRALDLSAVVIGGLAEGLDIPSAVHAATAEVSDVAAEADVEVESQVNGAPPVPGSALYEAPAAASAE